MFVLDFANTIATGRSSDALGEPVRAARWLAARIESADPVGTPATRPTSTAWARQLQAEALRLRDEVHALFEVVVAEVAPLSPPLPTLERALAAGRWTRRLDRTGPDLRLVESLAPPRTPLAVLAPYAASAAELAATVQPARLRRCGASDCRRWFVDTSRGGRRRWCSMATCGNRRKAARHRQRHEAS